MASPIDHRQNDSDEKYLCDRMSQAAAEMRECGSPRIKNYLRKVVDLLNNELAHLNSTNGPKER